MPSAASWGVAQLHAVALSCPGGEEDLGLAQIRFGDAGRDVVVGTPNDDRTAGRGGRGTKVAMGCMSEPRCP